MSEVTIRAFTASDLAAHLPQLGDLMHACVHSGASIGYVLPYSPGDAVRFWETKVLPRLGPDGGLILLVARHEGRIAGSVQLDHDTPPNQPHRAEVRKLMVHPDSRRRGIGRLLMARLEEEARRLARSLLTLDTRSGDHAEPLYASMGFVASGIIPDYCLDPFGPTFDSTTIMYKRL